MVDLKHIGTEQRNQNTMTLDSLSTIEILQKINEEDKTVAYAVEKQLNQIANVVEAVVTAFQNDGRLIYAGAGTSGRIGILDAVECPPTFGVSPDVVVGLLAGGISAFVKAIEGVEDSKELAVKNLQDLHLSQNDVVIAIAASGRTPYAIGAVEYANSIGAVSACITTSPNSALAKVARLPIEAVTGAEVLTGSTRMKSGTAQKLICNMITTTAMVKMGKVYENLMIDVQPTNKKLVSRAQRIVAEVTGVTHIVAQEYIDNFGGVKQAIYALLTHETNSKKVNEQLASTKGHLRNALKQKGETK